MLPEILARSHERAFSLNDSKRPTSGFVISRSRQTLFSSAIPKMPHSQSHPEIPPGDYCYTPIGLRKGPDGTPFFAVKRCPYFLDHYINGVRLPWCDFLKEGSVPNGLSFEDRRRLAQVGGTQNTGGHQNATNDEGIGGDESEIEFDYEVPEQYRLDLLWDQCKACGINR
jgi:hypothetical protein